MHYEREPPVERETEELLVCGQVPPRGLTAKVLRVRLDAEEERRRDIGRRLDVSRLEELVYKRGRRACVAVHDAERHVAQRGAPRMMVDGARHRVPRRERIVARAGLRVDEYHGAKTPEVHVLDVVDRQPQVPHHLAILRAAEKPRVAYGGGPVRDRS